jgi:hypothetical protein
MQNQPSASPLQLALEAPVRSAIRDSGRGEPVVSYSSLEVPFYNPGNPAFAIELIADGVHVWLHDDAAYFTVGTIQDGFERASFTSDDSFCRAFLTAFRTVLL